MQMSALLAAPPCILLKRTASFYNVDTRHSSTEEDNGHNGKARVWHGN
jgi:hypothetical protein